jgi:hypothetical protein
MFVHADMKRQGGYLACVTKRQCLQQPADAQDIDGCSSASPAAIPTQQQFVMMQPLLPQQDIQQQLAPALVRSQDSTLGPHALPRVAPVAYFVMH